MTLAGASDALLGAAVREWLGERMGQGARSEPVSGTPPTPSPALSAAAATAPKVPVRQEPKKPEPVGPEIVVFKDATGTRSSVSIAPADWATLVKRHQGDAAAARATVRQIAATAPPGENRSQWTRAKLLGAHDAAVREG